MNPSFIIEIKPVAINGPAEAPEHSSHNRHQYPSDARLHDIHSPSKGLSSLGGQGAGMHKPPMSFTAQAVSDICCINLLQSFGLGWFSYSLYRSLYDAAQSNTVRLSKGLSEQVEAFSQALLERDAIMHPSSTSLTARISQLRQVRMQLIDEFQPMSEQDAEACLWRWAETYMFTADQAAKPKKKKRSLFKMLIYREFGCVHRVRTIVQRGLQDFTNFESRDDLLQALISYIVMIESTTRANKLWGLTRHTNATIANVTETSHNLHVAGMCNPQICQHCRSFHEWQGSARTSMYPAAHERQEAYRPPPRHRGEFATAVIPPWTQPLIRAWPHQERNRSRSRMSRQVTDGSATITPTRRRR